MKDADIIRQRLKNQGIVESTFQNPAEVVQWMVAMQAQEFAMAKWAIGLRLAGCDDEKIEKSFNEGSILRTHLLRPTWHFVTAPDIRWLLELTAPHINAASAYYHRKSGLDKKTFTRSNDIFAKALEGEKHLTREELQAALEKEKIIASGIKLAYVMMVAELDGVICSGSRRGKQFTYALLDDRIPAEKKITRDEALVNLTQRFFASRGPATIQDLSYWSGLTIKELRPAILSLPSNFEREIVDGREYIFQERDYADKKKSSATFLMPDYDEYGMSYKNRDELYNKKNISFQGKKSATVFNHVIVVDGVYGGAWQRKTKGNKVVVEIRTSKGISEAKQKAVDIAKKKYMKFFGLK